MLPSGLYSTRSIPLITSREPLWDQPGLAKAVGEGRYFLPNSATGLRETIVTSPVMAEPEYVEIMPGPSPWPLVSAIFTAFMFLALTVQAYAFATFSGVVMLIGVLRWLWETDRPIRQTSADIGANIQRPTYRIGPSSHGWWALTILFVVFGMIMFMAAFGFLYLYGVHRNFGSRRQASSRSPPSPRSTPPRSVLAYIAGARCAAATSRAAASGSSCCWRPRHWSRRCGSTSAAGATPGCRHRPAGRGHGLLDDRAARHRRRAGGGHVFLLRGARDPRTRHHPARRDARRVIRVVRFAAIQGTLIAALTRLVAP